MKQLIILVSTVMLGVFIYNLIAGDDGNSVMSSVAEMWRSGLAERSSLGQ